ncbi:MAG: DNA (cytosine-5-)-methyltransferase [Candidatus Zophobacter franzmannii]|nr:DNA (cytosine-5-)-methyltransferase [Candidatus Zophobacter franzmannii]
MNSVLENARYIDLFAGIGGFHQAMNSFGGKCVFVSEWDKHASEVYFLNYGIRPAGDITQILETDIPEHDVLCAGFPCQAFSVSGKQKGFEDTRGTLFFDIVRIAKHHRPKLMLLENVRNFTRHNEGKTLKVVLTTLKEIGYNVYFKVLNASDYGLPQNRERIYFVCFRKDIGIDYFDFPQPAIKATSLHDVLENNPVKAKIVDRPDIVFTRNYSPDKDFNDEVLFPNRPIQIGYVNKGGQGERIYSPFGHAITLSAYGGGVGSKTGLYLVNGIVRKLSTRECARLQGFPDNFIIDISDSQAYKQFGNSVAISVLKSILNEVSKIKTQKIVLDNKPINLSKVTKIAELRH